MPDPRPPGRAPAPSHANPAAGAAHGGLGRFFADLGPGLITGAADDDPSGISTYSTAGASFGFAPLWMALFSFPLMAAVQLMCARLGLASGYGLAGAIRRYYPRWVLWSACALLVVANTVNIAADLAGMAAAMEMLTGIPERWWLVPFAALILGLLVWSSYRRLVQIFKWLTLVLFAYVASAFLAHPDWPAVLRATFVPHILFTRQYLAVFVAVMGTTISPYLFFWQTAQEVEEERSHGRLTPHQRRGATAAEMSAARTDVLSGMGFAGVVMYFIILTTGATLYTHGLRDIETARQAAEALRPLAGELAYLLFAMGLVGTGMLGVPVLAGSAAYAVAEAMHWRGSLDDRPRASGRFYLVLAAALIVGLVLDSLHFNAIRMLFWAAVVNGALAPPLIVLVVRLSSDRRAVGEHVASPLVQGLGWLTAGVMAVAAAAMFLT